MSKKVKMELTPEELAAKKIRKSNGWTRFWAIVLALVLTVGVFSIAKKQGAEVAASDETTTSSSVNNNNTNNNNNNNSNNPSNGATPVNNDNSNDTSSDSNTPVSSEAEEAAAAINAATAKAANAGYDWARNCVIENVDVGNATSAINTVIHLVDKNADINSVVGGFLGKGDKNNTIVKGDNDDAKKEKMGNVNYAIKATKLEPSDLKDLKVDGNTYTFTLPEATDPQKDDSTALARLTNDFITQTEVSDGIKDALGVFASRLTVKSSTVVFKDIKVTAVINNGTLESFKYSYYMDVQKLELSIATGTGHGTVEGSYSNFAY